MILVREKSLDAFDFLVVVFLKIGRFGRGRDGFTGKEEHPVFIHFPICSFVNITRKTRVGKKLGLNHLKIESRKYRDSDGFETIAKALGIPKPARKPMANCDE